MQPKPQATVVASGFLTEPVSAGLSAGAYEIWLIEADGARVLVRDDVVDPVLAQALVSSANHGAAIQGLAHSYVAVPAGGAMVVELPTDTGS